MRGSGAGRSEGAGAGSRSGSGKGVTAPISASGASGGSAGSSATSAFMTTQTPNYPNNPNHKERSGGGTVKGKRKGKQKEKELGKGKGKAKPKSHGKRKGKAPSDGSAGGDDKRWGGGGVSATHSDQWSESESDEAVAGAGAGAVAYTVDWLGPPQDALVVPSYCAESAALPTSSQASQRAATSAADIAEDCISSTPMAVAASTSTPTPSPDLAFSPPYIPSHPAEPASATTTTAHDSDGGVEVDRSGTSASGRATGSARILGTWATHADGTAPAAAAVPAAPEPVPTDRATADEEDEDAAAAASAAAADGDDDADVGLSEGGTNTNADAADDPSDTAMAEPYFVRNWLLAVDTVLSSSNGPLFAGDDFDMLDKLRPDVLGRPAFELALRLLNRKRGLHRVVSLPDNSVTPLPTENLLEDIDELSCFL